MSENIGTAKFNAIPKPKLWEAQRLKLKEAYWGAYQAPIQPIAPDPRKCPMEFTF